MYPNTEALVRLKEQTQATLDFAVLTSHSVPLLKMIIKKIEKKEAGFQLAKPDYFKGHQNQDQLKQYASEYKFNLSKYVLLSNFSYFEAYILDAIREMIKFHGGIDAMILSARIRCENYVDPTDPIIVENRKKLQDSYKKKNDAKYKKHTKILKEQNFKFPSELLSSFGIKKIDEELKNFRSIGIPRLLIDGLHFKMEDDEIIEFHRIRDIRNKIAHGECKRFDMPNAMKCNKFLRDLAVKIDHFLVSNYFVIEKFS